MFNKMLNELKVVTMYNIVIIFVAAWINNGFDLDEYLFTWYLLDPAWLLETSAYAACITIIFMVMSFLSKALKKGIAEMIDEVKYGDMKKINERMNNF